MYLSKIRTHFLKANYNTNIVSPQIHNYSLTLSNDQSSNKSMFTFLWLSYTFLVLQLDPNRVYTLHMTDMSLKCLLIYRFTFPVCLFFLTIYLLKNLDFSSCGIAHILDFTDCIFLENVLYFKYKATYYLAFSLLDLTIH